MEIQTEHIGVVKKITKAKINLNEIDSKDTLILRMEDGTEITVYDEMYIAKKIDNKINLYKIIHK